MQGQSAPNAATAAPKLAGPLYNQIQLLMRDRILAQEWREGTALPTEVDLAREYSVSVGTMRKALDVLEDAKFIIRKQGLGTFVRDQTARSDERISGWLVDGKPSTERVAQIVSRGTSDATAQECAALNLPARTHVTRIKLLSTIDNRGTVFDQYIIPETTGSALAVIVVESTGDIAKALQMIECQTSRYIESLAIDLADAVQAQVLRVAVGTPLMKIERMALDAKGRPLFMCIRTAHLGGARYQVQLQSH